MMDIPDFMPYTWEPPEYEEPEEPDYDRAYEESKEAELDARELVNNQTI